MREIILTNGEAIRDGQREIGQNLDPNVVSHAHLLEESNYLVSLATKEYSKEFSYLKSSRPMHRYQPAKVSRHDVELFIIYKTHTFLT